MSTTARQENITGADCTGTNGAANRTYALRYSGYLPATLLVHVQGVFAHPTYDYSIASGTITFLGNIYNDEYISIEYYTIDGVYVATGLPRYATTLQFARILGLELTIPVRIAGTTPTRENIGTGDGSTTIFYFQQRAIIDGSYTLYTGGTTEATATTQLTAGTHYVIDLAYGKITLTTAGVTAVSTNKIYATYSYLDPTFNFTDDYLAEVLIRSETRIDSMIQSTFVSDSANPEFPLIVREKQYSKGWFDRSYFTYKRPIKDISSELASSITSSSSSLTVTAGDGDKFPIAGYIIIGDEVIQYTSVSNDTLTGLTRGVFDTTAAAHASAASIHTTIFETSATTEGIEPTFKVLSYDSELFVDEEMGKCFVFQNATIAPDYIASNLHRFSDIADRIRITYFWGYDSIPRDIERLSLLIAKQELARDNITKSIIAGRGEFSVWNAIESDRKEIEDIVANYRMLMMGNV